MTKKPSINFAKAFEELEKITQWFDSQDQPARMTGIRSDGLDLDLGLKQFERGLELASELKKKLSEVENKVEEIKQKFSDSPTHLPT
ncbi:MAG: exodeoxyribonuclease VII small subunit [Patescibacteria group bacterium]